MKKFHIFKLVHRNADCIGLQTEKDEKFNALLKQTTGIKWSQTNKCWYGANTSENVLALKETLLKAGYLPLETDSWDAEDVPNTKSASTVIFTPEVESNIKKFVDFMQVHRLSDNTVDNYKAAVIVFLKHFHGTNFRDITQEQIVAFQKVHIIDRKMSIAYQNCMISAIKKFYEAITGFKPDYNFILRPKGEHPLPNILSVEEMKQVLTKIKNVKHKAMLCLIYGCGLRAGELLNLKPTDILSDRGMLHIKAGKGKKDRVVPISAKLVVQLRDYFKLYKPTKWLFEGVMAGERYSYRSLQLVLKQSLKKAGIVKKTRLHDLRHSYATHLMDVGTNQRFIQEALGHKSSKTTEIYTHVTKANLGKMHNPFDDLNL